MKTLKEKLESIIEDNGFVTSYMENMLYAIEKAEENDKLYIIKNDTVIKKDKIYPITWSLEKCIFEYMEINNDSTYLINMKLDEANEKINKLKEVLICFMNYHNTPIRRRKANNFILESIEKGKEVLNLFENN